MTEMNELTRSLVRVEELITQGASQGAQHVLWTAQEYARQAVKLISDQGALMAKQQLKINELSERMDYWQKRAESAEAEIKELDEQGPVGYGVEKFYQSMQDPSDCREGIDLYSADEFLKTDYYHEDPMVFPVYARPVPAKRVPDELRQWYIKLTNQPQVCETGEHVGYFCDNKMLDEIESILKIGE